MIIRVDQGKKRVLATIGAEYINEVQVNFRSDLDESQGGRFGAIVAAKNIPVAVSNEFKIYNDNSRLAEALPFFPKSEEVGDIYNFIKNDTNAAKVGGEPIVTDLQSYVDTVSDAIDRNTGEIWVKLQDKIDTVNNFEGVREVVKNGDRITGSYINLAIDGNQIPAYDDERAGWIKDDATAAGESFNGARGQGGAFSGPSIADELDRLQRKTTINEEKDRILTTCDGDEQAEFEGLWADVTLEYDAITTSLYLVGKEIPEDIREDSESVYFVSPDGQFNKNYVWAERGHYYYVIGAKSLRLETEFRFNKIIAFENGVPQVTSKDLHDNEAIASRILQKLTADGAKTGTDGLERDEDGNVTGQYLVMGNPDNADTPSGPWTFTYMRLNNVIKLYEAGNGIQIRDNTIGVSLVPNKAEGETSKTRRAEDYALRFNEDNKITYKPTVVPYGKWTADNNTGWEDLYAKYGDGIYYTYGDTRTAPITEGGDEDPVIDDDDDE